MPLPLIVGLTQHRQRNHQVKPPHKGHYVSTTITPNIPQQTKRGFKKLRFLNHLSSSFQEEAILDSTFPNAPSDRRRYAASPEGRQRQYIASLRCEEVWKSFPCFLPIFYGDIGTRRGIFVPWDLFRRLPLLRSYPARFRCDIAFSNNTNSVCDMATPPNG